MNTSAQNDAIRDQLIAIGVPEHIAHYAASLNPSSAIFAVYSFLYLVIMGAGFAAGAIAWSFLEKKIVTNAMIAAHEVGGLFYSHLFGISMLFALFGWIFGAAIVTGWLQLLSKRIVASMFVETISEPKNRLFLRLDNYLDYLAPFADEPLEYMKKGCMRWITFLYWPTAILFGIAAMSLEIEFRAFNIYTAKNAIVTPYFPWKEEKSLDWRDAESVSLGCNYVADGNDSHLIYEVKFQDGVTVRLSSAELVTGRFLDNLELIDNSLADAEVPFRRWKWLGRNPMHPKCLEHFRNTYSVSDFERVKALLRV